MNNQVKPKRNIPWSVICRHGCKKAGYPISAYSENNIYHFGNTGEPYALAICPNCNQATLIIL